MSHMNDQAIKDIKVIGVEKPQKGKFQEHFEYVIVVTYEAGYEHLIFRRYSMLFHFHSVLKEVVKEGYSSVIILPELPVAKFQHVGRKILRLNMNKELKLMTEFCQKIIVLLKCIAEKDIILKFFDQLGTDVAHAEAYQEEIHKGEHMKDQSDRVPSPAGADNMNGGDMSQYSEDQYRSIAKFDAGSTDELSVAEGETVTVIEKNTSGWWLVSNQSGQTGFTPATFLEPIEERENTGEWHTVTGPDNIYTAIKDYHAQCPDEISFRCGDEMEVLSMSNFGWWQIRHVGRVGLCPASSLTLKKSSAFQDPMNEYRKSILKYSKKGAEREAPPRTSSTKSCDSLSSDNGYSYNNNVQPERFSPADSSVKYTRIIPKHLRSNEPNNNSDNDKINYVNIPVIKNGTPHYLEGRDSEAINVHVVRKDYEKNGFCLREGEMVQVITVMPDGCFWKVATINPPFKEGLIPSELLCPELFNQIEDTCVHSATTTTIGECIVKDTLEPVRVLPRFTAPPSVRKPVPAPRTNTPKSPTVAKKGTSVIALVDYNPGQTDLLAFQKGDVGRLIKRPETGWWFIELKGFEGWVPVAYWEEVKEGRSGKTPGDISVRGFSRQWLFGKMSRDQCEDMFGKRGKHLDFIIRESVHRVGSYALSIMFNDKVHHFPIEKCASGKFLIGKLAFDELSEIVSHYTIHPLFYTDYRQPVSVGRPLSRT